MNLGTLIVGPREHIVAIAELDDTAAAELGPLPGRHVIQCTSVGAMTLLLVVGRIGDHNEARKASP